MTDPLNIIGQSPAQAAIRSAIKADRIPHAWLFHGPGGVGKFTTALQLAAFLLDPDAKVDSAGNVSLKPDSATRRQVFNRTHADLHIITKELAEFSSDDRTRTSKQTNISIRVVNEFILQPAFRSGHGPSSARASKVFIIDEAEMLDTPGQNRLLKTLEEPPERTVLILVSTSEDRLLPTIRSRSRMVAFERLTEEQMRRWVADNDVQAPPEALDFLLRFADGSPGQFRLAVEYNLYQWYETLAPMIGELNAGRYPVDAGTTMGTLVEELAANETKKKKHASKQVANRLGASLLMTLLSHELRRAIRAASNQQDAVEPFAEVVNLLVRAESQIASNANLKLVLENVAVQWAERCGSRAALS